MTSKSTKTVTKHSLAFADDLFVKPAVPWEPHDYQQKAVRWLISHGCGGLFLDPGLGKTSATLGAFKILKKKGLANRMIVAAPIRACQLTWPDELKKWIDFNHFTWVFLHGPKKEQLLWQAVKDDDVDILLVNFEGLEWLLNVTKTKGANGKIKVKVDRQRIKKIGADTLAIDELSRMKNPSTVRFKAVKQVLDLFARRWGLTGSPSANGLLDLFGQIYTLDMGNALGSYVTHFRNEFFVPARDGFNWELQEDGADRIYKAISPLVLRMSAEDHLKLPKEIANDIFVELPAEARRVYDELEQDLITELEAGTIVAANSGVAIGKCSQVASGGLYLADDPFALVKRPRGLKREWVELHQEKTDRLCDLIDELQGSPILVAYEYHHDLDRIRERLGNDVPYIGTGVNAKRIKEIERAWNSGKLPYLFGHPQSMALSLNLQEAANHVGWYTPTWNYELYDQLIRRVRRQGNTNKHVFVHRFLARDTVDEVKIATLLGKRRGQNGLFDALKALQKRRARR